MSVNTNISQIMAQIYIFFFIIHQKSLLLQQLLSFKASSTAETLDGKKENL
jgi:hypothetical protein